VFQFKRKTRLQDCTHLVRSPSKFNEYSSLDPSEFENKKFSSFSTYTHDKFKLMKQWNSVQYKIIPIIIYRSLCIYIFKIRFGIAYVGLELTVHDLTELNRACITSNNKHKMQGYKDRRT